MKVKIDTKEKFFVITLQESYLSANMTDNLKDVLLPYLEKNLKNLIIKFGEVSKLDKNVAETIVDLQKNFFDKNASFVICELQKPVQNFFEQLGLLHLLNFAPTESEAWDIVQMEEIEREYDTPNP